MYQSAFFFSACLLLEQCTRKFLLDVPILSVGTSPPFFFEGVPFGPRRNVVPGLALLDILEEVVDVQVLVVVQVPGEVDSHIPI